MTAAQRKRVVNNAIKAAEAAGRGEKTITLGSGEAAQTLNLRKGGYCAQFVRTVFETTLNLLPYSWDYRAVNARGMCYRLDRDGKSIPLDQRKPGDILGIMRSSGAHGHVAIYLGREADPNKELITENTSSGTRGEPRRPGTKLTRYSDIEARVTAVYRP